MIWTYSPRHEGTRVTAQERDGDYIARLQHLTFTPIWYNPGHVSLYPKGET